MKNVVKCRSLNLGRALHYIANHIQHGQIDNAKSVLEKRGLKRSLTLKMLTSRRARFIVSRSDRELDVVKMLDRTCMPNNFKIGQKSMVMLAVQKPKMNWRIWLKCEKCSLERDSRDFVKTCLQTLFTKSQQHVGAFFRIWTHMKTESRVVGWQCFGQCLGSYRMVVIFGFIYRSRLCKASC